MKAIISIEHDGGVREITGSFRDLDEVEDRARYELRRLGSYQADIFSWDGEHMATVAILSAEARK